MPVPLDNVLLNTLEPPEQITALVRVAADKLGSATTTTVAVLVVN